MRLTSTALALAVAITIGGCSDSSELNPDLGSRDTAPVDTLAFDLSTATSGSFKLLTYNVAGLPQGISGSDPEVNIPQISPLLNNYDIVLAQEDFFYTDALRASATHAFKSVPKPRGEQGQVFGDGLNRFSRFPWIDFYREGWTACFGDATNGSDCFGQKGFSYARVLIAEGVSIDVYNLHMDAGGGPQDDAARAVQVDQLLAALSQRSAGRAVLIGGDTNMNFAKPTEGPMLDKLIQDGGLTEACLHMSCGWDSIDRVFFRSGGDVTLNITSWEFDDRFVDAQSMPLSDHLAVGVTVSWSRQ